MTIFRLVPDQIIAQMWSMEFEGDQVILYITQVVQTNMLNRRPITQN